MVETLEGQGEISPEQKAAIIGDLEKVAKAHGVKLEELGKLTSMESEKTKSVEAFNEIRQDILLMQKFAGQRFLGWAGQLPRGRNIEDMRHDILRKETDFNGLCKNYKFIPPENRQEAEKFMKELNIFSEQLDDREKELKKKGLIPGKRINIKRSNGDIEENWVIDQYTKYGVRVIEPNKKLQKTIPTSELLSLN